MGSQPSNSIGPIVQADSLPLHVVSQTSSQITLGWTPPPGIAGYEFFNGTQRSSTWDPTRSSVKFQKTSGAVLRVVAVKEDVSGSYQVP